MDVYPRSKTWPYLTVVALLFALAVWYPRWWVTGEHSAHVGLHAASRATVASRGRGASPTVAAKQIEAIRVPLQPPIARRIAVSPEPAFAEAAETDATARFPRDSVAVNDSKAETLEVVEPASPPVPDVGPILPPGSLRPLELTPADIDGLATSLPTELMDHDLQLQSAADATAPLATTWPRPVSLWDTIGQLGMESKQVASWVNDVQDTLNQLQTIPSLEDPRALELCERMSDLARVAPDLEIYLTESNRRHLRRVRYGLDRAHKSGA